MRNRCIVLLVVAIFLAQGATLGQEGKKEGPRDGEGRDTLCVVPITKAPEADVMAALQKVFGKQLKVAVDKDLKVIIIQGPEAAVSGAIQALRDSIDTTPPRRPDGDREGVAVRSIEAVRLRKAKTETVAKLVKLYVSDKIEITERPNVPAIIFEGDASLVAQASLLAKQIDGQLMHPSVRRVLVPGEGERPREGDRPRDGDRPKPKGDGDPGQPKKDGDREKPIDGPRDR